MQIPAMDEAFLHTPVGLLKLKADETGLTSVTFWDEDESISDKTPSHPVLKETARQLSAYFDGELTGFDLPLKPIGTDFQQRVWKALNNVPFGSTTTYLELSKKLGDPNAIRAVGKANGQNPIAIIVPCHRVIGSNNNLIGYAGGIERKRRLLQHEGALLL